MIPTFLKPMKAMKRPIPAGIAFLRQSGSEVAIYFLSPVTERIRNTTPERRMMQRPSLYPFIGSSILGTIKDTKKKELRPIPQACAKGNFAYNLLSLVTAKAKKKEEESSTQNVG